MLYGKLEKSCNSHRIKLVVIILDETNYCKYAYMSIYVYLDEFIEKFLHNDFQIELHQPLKPLSVTNACNFSLLYHL